MTAALGMSFADALAQGWWPWSQEQPKPVPREPMRPAPGQGGPYQQGPYQQGPNQGGPFQPGAQQGYGRAGPSNLCLQLEQRLVAETQGAQGGREQLPRIESEMRSADRAYQFSQMTLDRENCYDQFLFSKTLRNTPKCVKLNSDMENAKRQLAQLDAQRRQIMGSRDRSYQDDIIRELARNGCGQQYTQEARRRDSASNPFSSLWGEESEGPRGGGGGNQFGNLPFATYRTLCVRLCDGYYFPVSFSTLPNHFQRDADLCQSQCAAPAELFYHQNPGGAVEQAVSVSNQEPYTGLKTAWRYRKEYVQGCSCKEAEYVPPQGGDRKAEGPTTTPATSAGSKSSTAARLPPR